VSAHGKSTEFMRSFARRLTTARADAAFTVPQLAAAAGVSSSTAYRAEEGFGLSLEHALSLAHAAGTTLGELCGENDGEGGPW
jgi:transcriptional regulator with XRE-family HTH domain